MTRYLLLVLSALSALSVRSAGAEPKVITPDLKAIAEGKGATIPTDVRLQWVEDAKGTPALKIQPTKREFSEKDTWVVALRDIEFTSGVIEFDALGQSDPPQSNFLGVAFRFVDRENYDAVYFRPFNFRADDPVRRIHAVQYISHPGNPWYDLRKNQPQKYEQPIHPPPDGDAWFHVRIVVEKPRLRVYVNDAREPSLSVEELSPREGGGIGLWVGPGRGGHIANLKITAAR